MNFQVHPLPVASLTHVLFTCSLDFQMWACLSVFASCCHSRTRLIIFRHSRLISLNHHSVHPEGPALFHASCSFLFQCNFFDLTNITLANQCVTHHPVVWLFRAYFCMYKYRPNYYSFNFHIEECKFYISTALNGGSLSLPLTVTTRGLGKLSNLSCCTKTGFSRLRVAF